MLVLLLLLMLRADAAASCCCCLVRQVVEEAAAEALGELQDLKDDLAAHKEARQAAERQVGGRVCRGRGDRAAAHA